MCKKLICIYYFTLTLNCCSSYINLLLSKAICCINIKVAHLHTCLLETPMKT